MLDLSSSGALRVDSLAAIAAYDGCVPGGGGKGAHELCDIDMWRGGATATVTTLQKMLYRLVEVWAVQVELRVDNVTGE